MLSEPGLSERDAHQPVYVFERCIIDLRQRTLLRDGLEQALEPLSFDVLAYLLTHRDRVVSHGELNEQVWKGKLTSWATLHRCVSLIRKTLSDSNGGESPIKTAHRVGYQFRGVIRHADSPELHVALLNGSSKRAEQGKDRTVLVLTGSTALDMTPSADEIQVAFARAAKYWRSPAHKVEFVLAVADGLPETQQRHGFTLQLAFETDPHQRWVHWRLSDGQGRVTVESMSGDQWVEILRRVAEQVTWLFENSSHPPTPQAFTSEISLQLYAQAERAMDSERWCDAEDLFRQLEHANPGHMLPLMGQLAALSYQRSPDAAALAARIEQVAHATGNQDASDFAQLTLAVISPGAVASCLSRSMRVVADRAIAKFLTADELPNELELRTLHNLAYIEALQKPLSPEALVSLDHFATLPHPAGRLRRPLLALQTLAGASMLHDNLPAATEYLDRADWLLARSRLPLSEMFAIQLRAMLLMRSGSVTKGLQSIDQGLDLLPQIALADADIYIVSGHSLALFEVCDLPRLKKVCTLLVSRGRAGEEHPALTVSKACLAAAEGRLPDALHYLKSALGTASLQGELYTHLFWLLALLRLQMAAGDLPGATATLEHLREQSGDQHPSLVEVLANRLAARPSCGKGTTSALCGRCSPPSPWLRQASCGPCLKSMRPCWLANTAIPSRRACCSRPPAIGGRAIPWDSPLPRAFRPRGKTGQLPPP